MFCLIKHINQNLQTSANQKNKYENNQSLHLNNLCHQQSLQYVTGKPRDRENDPHVRWPTVSASSSPRLWIPFRVPFSPVLFQTSHANRD